MVQVWRKVGRNVDIIVRDTLVNSVAGAVFMPYPLRYAIYRLYGVQTQTARIRARCWFNGSNVSIGRGSFVNYGCFFDARARIDIGTRCSIAMEVMFCTSSYIIGGPEHRAETGVGYPITVGNGCWIGTRALILPGVTIGDGCVIAAGSVVTKDCEPHGLYAGVPSKRIRNLPTASPHL